MEWLTMERWSPYGVGIGIGILSWITFLLSDKPIGGSTAFSRTSGMIERFFRGKQALEKPYYQKFPAEIDWEWMLVVGVLAGASISATLSGQFRWVWVPPKWADTFGPFFLPRWLASLIGGMFLGFGARWAGGCTSGHGISGTLQLAVSSWIAALCFFAGGIVTVAILF